MTAAASAGLVFKTAAEPWELEEVARLNYRTFVEEIPQHGANPDAALVDKFDAENTYLVCLQGRELLGMIAVRGTRPFSLDQKLDDLDRYLPPHNRVCEFRLLSVAPDRRNGKILVGLMDLLNTHCLEQGYDLAVISGTTRQQKLYRHLGFVPFGPLVGQGDVLFQPMYLTLEHAERHAKPFLKYVPVIAGGRERAKGTGGEAANGHAPDVPDGAAEPVNLLPGPVGIRPEVRAALAGPPVSHRAEDFVAAFDEVKAALRRLTGAAEVEILMGSGTLANDAVAGQLSLLGGRGVVLANGEFGERLLDHATRWGLDFAPIRADWGEPLERSAIEAALDEQAAPAPSWIWAVHSETSTGVLNDLAMLKAVAAARDARLCVDGISALGTVPVDLSGVYLASGVSGKGLGAFPGLSMVFADHRFASDKTLPRYLDLGLYAAADGIPFTISSNLVAALAAALEQIEHAPPDAPTLASLAAWLRTEIEEMGIRVLAAPEHASPAVLTLTLPPALDSNRLGARLRDAGFLLSYQSRYLLDRNWIQICLMGECRQDQLVPLLGLLRKAAG